MIAFPQVRRPLVGVACSVGLGLCLEQQFGWSPLLLLSLSAFLLAMICRGAVRFFSLGVYASCLLLAATYGAIERCPAPLRSVLPVAEAESSQQELYGVITDDPVVSRDGSGSAEFAVRAVRLHGQWRAADSRIQVYFKNQSGPVAYGEYWKLIGRYRSGEYSGYFSADGADAVRVRPASVSLKGACYNVRRRAVAVFEQGMAGFPQYTQVVQALLLGYRKVLPDPLYRTFSLTGTLHIFAISGLHVGVMASILIAALKIMGVPKPRWGYVLIPLLFLYVVATGMKPSAFRAFTMAAIYFAAPFFRRRPDPASAIALAAIILLCIDPLQLGDPGFLLSFTVVSGIVMVHAYVSHRLNGFHRPSWMLPLTQLRGPTPWVAMMRGLGALVLTSGAAWIFSAPLTARFFNTLSPVALVGNLVIIPLTFMVVLTGCWTLFLAMCSLPWIDVFNHANQMFTHALIAVIRALGDLPGAYFFVRGPSGIQLALWYSGLALIFAGPRRLQRVGLLASALAGLLWAGGLYPPASGVTGWRERDTSLAVQIEPGQWILVVEGTPYSLARTVRRCMREGVHSVRALVISGKQVDQEVVRELQGLFPAEQICLHPHFRGSDFAKELARAGAEMQFAARPQWTVGDGVVSVNLTD